MDAKKNGNLPAVGQGLQEMVDTRGNMSFVTVGNGLTKREAFAIQAPLMPEWYRSSLGYASNNPRYPQTRGHFCEGCRAGTDCDETPDCKERKASQVEQDNFKKAFEMEVVAKWAVAYADALLAELAKEA